MPEGMLCSIRRSRLNSRPLLHLCAVCNTCPWASFRAAEAQFPRTSGQPRLDRADTLREVSPPLLPRLSPGSGWNKVDIGRASRVHDQPQMLQRVVPRYCSHVPHFPGATVGRCHLAACSCPTSFFFGVQAERLHCRGALLRYRGPGDPRKSECGETSEWSGWVAKAERFPHSLLR